MVLAQTLIFYEKIAAHKEARQMIDQYCILLDEHYIDRYIGAAFQEKGYMYNELFRVQKLNLDAQNMCQYQVVCRGCARSGNPHTDSTGRYTKRKCFDLKDKPAQQKVYFDKITALVRSVAPEINVELLNAAMKVPIAASEGNSTPIGKFLAILFARAKDFRKGQKAKRLRTRISRGFLSRSRTLLSWVLTSACSKSSIVWHLR